MAFSGSGSGTEADPYMITNDNELEQISEEPDAYYQLANNIDATNISEPLVDANFRAGYSRNMDYGSGYTPAKQAFEFRGVLDGNGYTINNYSLTGENGVSPTNVSYGDSYDSGEAGEHVALIKKIGSQGVVKNLTLDSPYFNGGDGAQGGSESESGDGGYAATIALINNGRIENVSVTGSATADAGTAASYNGDEQAGYGGEAAGLVHENNGDIINCDTTAPPNATDGKNSLRSGLSGEHGTDGGDAGGLAVKNNGKIEKSDATGAATAGAGGSGGNGGNQSNGGRGGDAGDAAGLCVVNNNLIQKCSATGNVTTKNGGNGGDGEEYADGLPGGRAGDGAGLVVDNSGGEIIFSHAEGSVTTGAGGNGGNGGYDGEGARGGRGGDAGGLAVRGGVIENSYATGSLSTGSGSGAGSTGNGAGADGGRGGHAAGISVENSTIRNCYSECDITSTGNGASGYPGSAYGSNDYGEDGGPGGSGGQGGDAAGIAINGTVTNSYAKGSISISSNGGDGKDGGDAYCDNAYDNCPDGGDGGDGGDAGSASGLVKNGSVTNSYAAVSISASGTGGSRGLGGAGKNCGNTTCAVDGSDGVAGSDGNIYGLTPTATVTDSYYDQDVSGTTNGSGTAYSTSQMTTQSNFPNWDFSVHWSMAGGCNSGYPALRGVTPCAGSPPAPEADFVISSPAIPTVEDEIDFEDRSTQQNSVIDTWDWSFGDSNSSNSQNPSHTYSQDKEYEVSLTVQNADGSSSTVTKTVLIVVPAGPGVLPTGSGIVK